MKWVWVGLLALLVSGCGLMMNKQYAERLDTAALLAQERAQKAKEGQLTDAEMVQVLQDSAAKWKVFKEARGPWIGFSPLWANATYARLLEKATGLSAEQARRAATGAFSSDELKQVLKVDAELWQLFKEAREGVAPEDKP